jgi:hypothetical protein
MSSSTVQLRQQKDLAVKQVKKLKKKELEQVSKQQCSAPTVRFRCPVLALFRAMQLQNTLCKFHLPFGRISALLTICALSYDCALPVMMAAQICIECGVSPSGLKAVLVNRLTEAMDNHLRFSTDPNSGQANTHAEQLKRMIATVARVSCAILHCLSCCVRSLRAATLRLRFSLLQNLLHQCTQRLAFIVC